MNPIPWLRLLAHDGCDRHAAATAHERDRARRLGRDNDRAITELRLAMMIHAAAVDDASDGRRHQVALRSTNSSAHGFVVTATRAAVVSGTLAIDLHDEELICRFTFAREPRRSDAYAYAISRSADGPSFCMWRDGVASRFASPAALSGHLFAQLDVTVDVDGGPRWR